MKSSIHLINLEEISPDDPLSKFDRIVLKITTKLCKT